MICSLHLVDSNPLQTMIRAVPKVAKTPGLLWSGKTLTAELSPNSLPKLAALKDLQLGRGGFVAWWEDDAALDAFLASSAGAKYRDGFTMRLKPSRVRDKWPGIDLHPLPNGPEPHDGPHVGITLGTSIVRTVSRFLRVSGTAEQQLIEDPNALWGIGLTTPPTLVMTISLWKDSAATDAYVHSGAHAKLIEDHYDWASSDHEFITEGGFFGFQPYGISGALTGRNPTPAMLADLPARL